MTVQRIQIQTAKPVAHFFNQQKNKAVNKTGRQMIKIADIALTKNQLNNMKKASLISALGMVALGGYDCTEGYDGPSCANPDFCF